MADGDYETAVRSALDRLAGAAGPGPNWEDLAAGNATKPAAAIRGVWILLGTALLILAFAGGLFVLGASGGRGGGNDPVQPAPVESTTTLPAIELGTGYLWPPQPIDLTPTDLAVRFVEETLGWDAAGGTLFSDSDPDGEARVHVQQAGVAELIDVISVPSGDGRVVVEVGPPWAVGADIRPSDSGGTAVSLLPIGPGIVAEVTLRLSSGEIVSGTGTITIGSAVHEVMFPDVDPVSVVAVLIRYSDPSGVVVAANGDARPPLAVER